MTDDIDELGEKIASVKNARKAPKENSREGIQVGIELFAAMGVCGTIGYFIDGWADTKPLFMIIFFFIGVVVGFYNIYRISMNVGYGVGYGTKEEKASLEPDSSLQSDPKHVKKTQNFNESE